MKQSPAKPHPLLVGGTDDDTRASGELFDSTDWSATPLGAAQGWPQSLRIAVSLCLNSRFPMFVWWGPSLINIYNDAYAPVLGKRHPGAFGRPAIESWSDIWPVLAPQVDAVMRQGRATWNERVLLVMERNGYPEDTWFTWSYSPIYDDEGSVGGLFCACTEETARVLAERERDRLVREAQDTARMLRVWFDSAPGFVALLRGPEFVFEMANQAYRDLVGRQELEGLPAFEALPDARDQGFEELLRKVYDAGERFVGRAVPLRLRRQGSGAPAETYVDFVYEPVRDSQGRVAGIFVQGHDVTEQVLAAKALREADRQKDEFLATLAHELRNPLAPIRQAVTLARMPRQDEARRDWALDVIARQAGHMALLLDDLLDVSRISRGRLQLRLQDAELHAVVQAAVETARPQLEAKQHRLQLDLPPAPVPLRADPVRLAQVLSNLLSNAGKYTDPHGLVEVRASVQRGQLTLAVRDNGIGLSPEGQEQIFHMFSQVSSALDRAEGGLGIGLALSRGLVGLHGGTLQVRSEGLGRGAEFIVTLPQEHLEAPAVATAAPAVPQPATPARSILVADDNPDALQTLVALLELEGHQVRAAGDGTAALAQIEAQRPQLAILDIGMPGLNGYEVARRVRALPGGEDVRLVALTGWGQAEDVERARAAGFDQHLTKPVDFSTLHALLAQA